MGATVVSFVMLTCVAAGVQDGENLRFVFEGGSPFQVSQRAGVIELRGGTGRLRTPRVFSDFTLDLDFRLGSPDTNAAVFIRTRAGGRNGALGDASVYRIPLSDDAFRDPSSALRAVRGNARVIRVGDLATHGPEEWQHLRIAANGLRVDIALNGAFVGEFEIGHFAGHVVFEARKGTLHIRKVIMTKAPVMRHEDAGSIARPGTDGVSWPKVLREAKPFYTVEAMIGKVQGIVEVDALVLADGSVGTVEVKRSLDPDLDQSAVAAVRQWKFAPATREGLPVPVLVPVEVWFKLVR